ncbi:hypothetical protein ACP275_12G000500 [Erythranthe tilingii]
MFQKLTAKHQHMEIEAFDSYDDNTNTMPIFQCLPQIMKKILLRIAEIFLILVLLLLLLLLLLFTRLPVKITVVVWQLISVVIISPLFIFLMGNVIVFMLILKSPRHNLFGNSQLMEIDHLGLIISHLEFIMAATATNADINLTTGHAENSVQDEEQVHVIFQDKHTVFEDTTTNVINPYRWSSTPSEINPCSQQRVAADDGIGGGGGKLSSEMVDDEMTNEEFQRAVEDFIANQIKFHQQEKHAILTVDGRRVT